MLLIFFLQCKKEEVFKSIGYINRREIINNDNVIHDESWFNKDALEDSIPGLSLLRADKTILNTKRGEKVIVAVIDTKFDINHFLLKDFIWKNPKETLNHKDDDNNGYVDDIYGWNFIGNNQGENVVNANYESVRILRYYRGRFENKDSTQIKNKERLHYATYIKAKDQLKSKLILASRQKERSNKIRDKYVEARNALKSYFPDYNYTTGILESIDTTQNPHLIPYINEIREVIKWKESDEMIISLNKSYTNDLDKRLNIAFNERALVGDNPDDINDSIYGNNNVFSLLKTFNHGTRVSSTITSVFNNHKSQLKIMPLSVVPSGNFQDKDLALAIRYAVNNGAKVINMSFGKELSLHKEWVFDAIKYAEEHNVLLINASGNSSKNIDIQGNTYPIDTDNDRQEIADNFLCVGSSTFHLNENLKSRISNYGKKNVDVFAPGENLHSALPFNKTRKDSGTSLASALTSGVAALIFSYYPNLTASQVKHIIMDSGVEYTFPVKTPTRKDKDKMTPFNELSKSGKIVNTYNALIMADSISKKKKSK